jgi:Ala-tRNA(Pro) deacylase
VLHSVPITDRGVGPPLWEEHFELVVDPELLEHKEIYFNAALLDRSIALPTSDYQSLAHPRTAPIAANTVTEG